MNTDYYIKRLERKELVNQVCDDDVIIYNIRRVLPVCVPINVFNETLHKLTQEDSNLMVEMYNPMQLKGSDGNISNFAVLNTINYAIDSNEFESIIKDEQINMSDKETLLENYIRNGDHYVLKRNYDDISDIKIARILKKSMEYSKLDDNYVRLSNIFENIEQIEKTNIFRVGMFVNTLHQYFYRKNYDHIPGLMLIEAARQIGYSVSYRFLGVVMSEVVFALTNLNIKFYNYLESNIPVYIQAVWHGKEINFKKLNRDLGLLVTSFYQNEKENCCIDISAKTIANKIFKRIRRSVDNVYNNPVFIQN